MKCEHKRTKENFPFGRKSKSDKVCKDCGMIITNHMIAERIMKRKKAERRFYKNVRTKKT